jgi:hypothetical protein
LAHRIETAHQATAGAARTAIEQAIECGRLQHEARGQVSHGEWLRWIEGNLSFGRRQAQKYMRLAEHADALLNATSNSHLAIDQALAALADRVSEPAGGPTEPPQTPEQQRQRPGEPQGQPIGIPPTTPAAHPNGTSPDPLTAMSTTPAAVATSRGSHTARSNNRPLSRAALWAQACNDAQAALERLVGLQGEFEQWRDALPENLSSSLLGERLDAICDLDLQSVLEVVEEGSSTHLPMDLSVTEAGST